MRLEESHRHTRVLLLAEDDKPVRWMLAELLMREGYIVYQTGDGLEAAALFPKIAPDLVLTDYEMPKMGGEALARLVHGDRDLRCPVILMTGKPEMISRNHTLRNSFEAVVAKPFQVELLLSVIRECINQ